MSRSLIARPPSRRCQKCGSLDLIGPKLIELLGHEQLQWVCGTCTFDKIYADPLDRYASASSRRLHSVG